MSVAETRLNAYLAAEAAILKAQEVRGGDTSHRMAELADVRAQIDKLQAQVNREQSRAAGRGPFGVTLANLAGR